MRMEVERATSITRFGLMKGCWEVFINNKIISFTENAIKHNLNNVLLSNNYLLCCPLGHGLGGGGEEQVQGRQGAQVN